MKTLSAFNCYLLSTVNSSLAPPKWHALWVTSYDASWPTIECDVVNCMKCRVSLSQSSCYVDPVWCKADVLCVVM